MSGPRPTIVVLAKAPRPGRVKTRLCPPCTPMQAAALAEAALRDTLASVLATPGIRPLVALDGDPGPWLPPGVPVVGQRSGTLDRRIAGALADAGGPALLLGMDTPQVTPELLAGSVELLGCAGVDAVLGPTEDGGYWAIGVTAPAAEAVVGVPMSTSTTGAAQRARLDRLGWHTRLLPRLRDVDTAEDARAVAAAAPHTLFAAAVAEIGLLDPAAASR